jgi:Holliday junction DNA helicase RuvA
MIGFLQGKILNKSAESLLLLVGGVGYHLECPASTIWALPKSGENAALYVSTVVREDAIRLFGFVTDIDKMVFEALIAVPSVGPKLALGLLGPLNGVDLVSALHVRDEAKLLAVPGVGSRKLEKLLVEMGPKLDRLWASCQNQRQAQLFQDNFDPLSPVFGESEAMDATLGASARSGALARAAAMEAAAASRNHRQELLADLESALSNIGHRDKFIKPCLDWIQQQWTSGEVRPELEESLRSILQRQSARLVTTDPEA